MNLSNLTVLTLVVLFFTGCTTISKVPVRNEPMVQSLQDLTPHQEPEREDQSIVNVEEKPFFYASATQETEVLPDINVGPVSFSNVSVYDAVRAITEGTGISLTFAFDNPDSQLTRHATTAVGVKGKLTDVLSELSRTMGFYYRFKDNTLIIEPDAQFMTSIPPVNDIFETVPVMLKSHGATNVFLDISTRTISYRATRTAAHRIDSFLKYVRENKALIVYDTSILEVRLFNNSSMGINWNALPTSPEGAVSAIASGIRGSSQGSNSAIAAGIGSAATLTGGVGASFVISSKNFSMNTLIDFLRSQGTLNSISQPKIQVISGGKASLNHQISTSFISRISPSTISGGIVVPGAIETSNISTGISVNLVGDLSEGTIYTDIGIRVSDLLELAPVNAGGTTIRLPKISERNLNTITRARPGDVVLLAGIQFQTVSDQGSGAPDGKGGVSIPTSVTKNSERTELVIVLKTKLVRFKSK